MTTRSQKVRALRNHARNLVPELLATMSASTKETLLKRSIESFLMDSTCTLRDDIERLKAIGVKAQELRDGIVTYTLRRHPLDPRI